LLKINQQNTKRDEFDKNNRKTQKNSSYDFFNKRIDLFSVSGVSIMKEKVLNAKKKKYVIFPFNILNRHTQILNLTYSLKKPAALVSV
jgi:hypothetical protein